MESKAKIDPKTWIEISKSALLHNLGVFRKVIGPRKKIAAVIKANAYGHGLDGVVSVLRNKTDWFAVDNLDEALLVRKQEKEKPILVLGYTTNSNLKKAIEKNISITIYNFDQLTKIASLKLKTKAKIHLKVETGLNRQGIYKEEVIKFVNYIKKNENYIVLEGISTHFADIEDTLDSTYAMNQLENLKKIVSEVKKTKIKPPLIHCAASAGALLYPDTHFSMIRVGISLYGLWPSKETRISLSMKKGKKIILKPVLSWKSTVAQVKSIKKGESVGYGRTWFASKNSKIAVIPVGYSDGYDRKLSNTGRVIIKGKYAPVVGRVAMNMIMADITEVGSVKQGDIVTLLGKGNDIEVTAEDIASKIGTINYEVVSRINPLLPRILVK